MPTFVQKGDTRTDLRQIIAGDEFADPVYVLVNDNGFYIIGEYVLVFTTERKVSGFIQENGFGSDMKMSWGDLPKNLPESDIHAREVIVNPVYTNNPRQLALF